MIRIAWLGGGRWYVCVCMYACVCMRITEHNYIISVCRCMLIVGCVFLVRRFAWIPVHVSWRRCRFQPRKVSVSLSGWFLKGPVKTLHGLATLPQWHMTRYVHGLNYGSRKHVLFGTLLGDKILQSCWRCSSLCFYLFFCLWWLRLQLASSSFLYDLVRLRERFWVWPKEAGSTWQCDIW